MTLHPQRIASDPRISAFVAANAGSGKTKTLVERVARLLLHRARPETILCVTYTKAAAAEMQRRLYQQLGAWSVMEDGQLKGHLTELGEEASDLADARSLFARALETPGGLKVQTLHAFCEKLLQRFPLEAGVTPGFKVMDEVAAAEVSAKAREKLAHYARDHPLGLIAAAYAHFAVELDILAFEGLLRTFEIDLGAIEDYVQRCGGLEGAAAEAWRRCGFPTGRPDPETIERDGAALCDWDQWRDAAAQLSASSKTSNLDLGQGMGALAEAGEATFAQAWRLFSTDLGAPRVRMGTGDLPPSVLEFLRTEQDRLGLADQTAKAARVARDTVFALRLAQAYAAFYQEEKRHRGSLDFADLIAKTHALLTDRADAAWVLYKLDGGVDHVLLDEAQDTSPEQWEILKALTSEFFVGAGGREGPVRTLFAVGDEKQSIFSFQGADPDQLHAQTSAYVERATSAGSAFHVVPLLESWRSTPEVLSFVDTVFADPSTRSAVRPSPGTERVVHEALRFAGYGTVDLWPLYQDEPTETEDAWDAPLDAAAPRNARKRLAKSVAEAIGKMLVEDAVTAKGDPTAPALRKVSPGDILILVRRRDALFEELIRALKRARIPVAGADRLKLSDHVAFHDILSLCRFCLFPEDDLALAELLRSPFCEVDEQGLFDLAHGRSGPLWAALRARAGERTSFEAARIFLEWARAESVSRAPFDFLGRVLSRLDSRGSSMRQRFLTRLGREAEDALDEIMAQVLAAEGRGMRELEGVTAALERADIEVRRELDTADGGQVRVMTVHGAKGLEAPIVILPDTTGRPPPGRATLVRTKDGGLLMAPRKRDDCPASREARALGELKTAEEQLRLLYVALTRARDRLIITGRLSAREKAAPDGSWYRLIENAFDTGLDGEAVRTVIEQAATLRRFGAEPRRWTASDTEVGVGTVSPPEWISRAAPAEPRLEPRSPSAAIGARRFSSPSPAEAEGGLGRFMRGELIHRLLQSLPDLPAEEQETAAWRLMNKQAKLTDDQREEMIGAALRVIRDDRFADVFGPGSRAEAAVAGHGPGLPEGFAISGRVDRMVATADRVLVVDFKTNRPSPERIQDADPAYIRQMAIYVAVLQAIFPAQRVEAALVWTDGPKLMPVPDNLIGAALATLCENN